jgi:hypothetical protein
MCFTVCAYVGLCAVVANCFVQLWCLQASRGCQEWWQCLDMVRTQGMPKAPKRCVFVCLHQHLLVAPVYAICFFNEFCCKLRHPSTIFVIVPRSSQLLVVLHPNEWNGGTANKVKTNTVIVRSRVLVRARVWLGLVCA